jgi:hypothetical protein
MACILIVRFCRSANDDEALDDMLFSGGHLNARLLGGAQGMAA